MCTMLHLVKFNFEWLFIFLVVDCEAPPYPGDHGNVTYVDTTFGSTATYTCISDCYELEPNVVTRLCQSNGHWSSDDPQCLCKSINKFI